MDTTPPHPTPEPSRPDASAAVAAFVGTAQCLAVVIATLGDHTPVGVRDVGGRAGLAVGLAMGPLTGWFLAGFPPTCEGSVFLGILTALSGGPTALALAAREPAAAGVSALFWVAGGYFVIALLTI